MLSLVNMSIFLTLFFKIIPLYLLILLGYIFGKTFKPNQQKISFILVYVIVPIIIFHSSYSTQLNLGLLSLPFIYFFLSSFVCLIFYYFSKNIWSDNSRNILAFSSGIGNTGYFGLPVITVILGEKVIPVLGMILLGTSVYQATIGFFIAARGQHSVKESLIKLAKLPLIYAFLIGIIFNLLKINLGNYYQIIYSFFFSLYTLLGMMIIGMAFSDIKKFVIDYKFIFLSFFGRFIFWPLLTLSLIYFDHQFFHLFMNDIQKTLFVTSLVPLAANTVSFASLLNVQPQKAAVAVLLSTLFALFYIPLIVSLFLKV